MRQVQPSISLLVPAPRSEPSIEYFMSVTIERRDRFNKARLIFEEEMNMVPRAYACTAVVMVNLNMGRSRKIGECVRP